MKIKKTTGAPKAHLLCIYGTSGVGKTTFASQFPNPLFICAEDGLSAIPDINYITPENFFELPKFLLGPEVNNYQSIIIDSLDWLEALLYKNMLAKYLDKNGQTHEAVGDIGGGYGKYIAIALAEWRSLIDSLNLLRAQGKNIVLVSHYQIKTHNDPTLLDPYDKYQLKLQDRVSALIKEWVDVLMFVNHDVQIKRGKGLEKNKALGSGGVTAHLTQSASFDAKNRFGLPNSYNFTKENSYGDYIALFESVQKNPDDTTTIVAEINELITSIEDVALVKNAVKFLNENSKNAQKLFALKQRLLVLKQGDKT